MSTSSGAMGTALNVASGDAGASLGGNLLNGKGLSIKNNDSALQAMALPGLSTLFQGGGSSGSSGASGKLGQVSNTTNAGSTSNPAQAMVTGGGAGVQSGGIQQSGGYQAPNAQVITNPAAFGQIDTSVGGSQLGTNMTSQGGVPSSLIQALAQNGRSVTGY